MDRFENAVRKGVFGDKLNLPGLKTFDISYDMFNLLRRENLIGVKTVKIYDEDCSFDIPKMNRVYQVINMINDNKSIKKLELELSDTSLYEYIRLMSNISMRNDLQIDFYRTINRNPLYKGDVKSNLDKCKGKLCIKPEDLMMESDIILRRLNGIVDPIVLSDTDKLKDIVREMMNGINARWDIEKMPTLEKVSLVYDIITKNIRYPDSSNFRDNGIGGYTIKDEYQDSGIFSRAYTTIVNQEGVCEGQARLGKALLNNYDMNVECSVLTGKSGPNAHAWLGIVDREKLYQVCFTGYNLFRKNNYVLDSFSVYPKCFPIEFLERSEVDNIKERVKLYKRR
jgi:hypothetical protein